MWRMFTRIFTMLKYIRFVLPCFLLTVSLCSCQNGEEPGAEGTGKIVLQMSAEDISVEASTRALQSLTNLDGYSFLLTGTDSKGAPVSKVITFQKDGDRFYSIVAAGEYTLTADNEVAATTGNGVPYYRGTSSSFTFVPGGTANVSIDLGSPLNARVDLSLDALFSSLYDLISVSFSDDTDRENTLTSAGTVYVMPTASGKVSYTVRATAKAGSHVSDLPSDGLTVSLSVSPGKSHSLCLTAQSIQDILIEIADGEHDGAFDCRR